MDGAQGEANGKDSLHLVEVGNDYSLSCGFEDLCVGITWGSSNTIQLPDSNWTDRLNEGA